MSAKQSIAIFGSGGVGGYFGARLAAAGNDVSFVARGAHLKTMLADGLSIESPEGNVHINAVKATDNPAEIGVVDIVLVCVKAWQLADACKAIRPLVGADTAIIPLLNGVDAPAMIKAEFGDKNALAGSCGIVAQLEKPGLIRHVGIKPFVRIGELNNEVTSRVSILQQSLMEAGVRSEIPEDIQVALWRKFLFIAPCSGVGSVTRASLGVMRETPETRSMIEQAMFEALLVGQAVGVNLTETDVQNAMKLLEASPADGTTSMQRDIADGRPSELEFQTGAIVRMGKTCGIETPVNLFLYHSLLPQERLAVASH